MDFQIEPKVDAAREFLEIAGDFTNPLELIREAISNSIDAGAKRIDVEFNRPRVAGRSTLVVEIRDNGQGMDREGLQSFFDLGNSSKRSEEHLIGEKGHGTKVYFNCSSIKVITTHAGTTLTATMNQPFASLHDGMVPQVQVTQKETPDAENGTIINIVGFNSDNGEAFTHEKIKDYINWFTKFGSWEKLTGKTSYLDRIIVIQGLNAKAPESIPFGHFFPDESVSVDKLFDEHIVRAPDFFSKRIVKNGNLRRYPEVEFNAVFSIEGNKVKQSYNNMLRRPGYSAPAGAYTVQERYGIWLCKDFIPVERKNEWISTKGSEYTKFHAFVNCQALSLTANRGSVANTPPEVLEDLREAIESIYEEIISGDEWRQIDWLEEQANAYATVEKETKDFAWRQKKASGSNIASFEDIVLVEPTRESGVYALLVQLMTIRPELFPFEIVDYDTHSGIDVIAKLRDKTPVASAALHYVELKYFLGSSMNHSFSNIRSIVCWDTSVKHGGTICDLAGEERTLYVAQPEAKSGGYTGYFLRRDYKTEIEVFVLRDYLRETLGLEFRPRNVAQIAQPVV